MNCYEGEKGYLELLEDTLKNGEIKETRNGKVYSKFGTMITFKNISEEFPLLTSKKMFFKGIIEELLWFLRGSTNVKELQNKGVHIWDLNSSREYLDSINLNHYDEGELGPVYGWQWRNFDKPFDKPYDKSIKSDKNYSDQIKYILEELDKNYNSRRAVLSAWNPNQIKEMALPPCHMTYSFYKNSKGLSCLMHMRSTDLFLGLPFNIASTATLLTIIATLINIKPYAISIVSTDAHIYEEHIDAINIQLKNPILSFPKIEIVLPDNHNTIEEKITIINNLKYEDFKVINYISANSIKAKIN